MARGDLLLGTSRPHGRREVPEPLGDEAGVVRGALPWAARIDERRSQSHQRRERADRPVLPVMPLLSKYAQVDCYEHEVRNATEADAANPGTVRPARGPQR